MQTLIFDAKDDTAVQEVCTFPDGDGFKTVVYPGTVKVSGIEMSTWADRNRGTVLLTSLTMQQAIRDHCAAVLMLVGDEAASNHLRRLRRSKV